jgi:hypothetical protein
MQSSGMLRLVALAKTDVSEEHSAFINRMRRIGELGSTSAVTSHRHTLRRSPATATGFLDAVIIIRFVFCEVDYEECRLLECGAAWALLEAAFWRSVSPSCDIVPSSRILSILKRRLHVTPKHRF